LYDIIDSKAILPCFRLSEPKVPFNSSKDFSPYKLYLSDVVLFVTLLFNGKAKTEENIYSKLLSDKLDESLGYLWQNAVAQMLVAGGRELYCFSWKESRASRPQRSISHR
jgi:uncharacterized protein